MCPIDQVCTTQTYNSGDSTDYVYCYGKDPNIPVSAYTNSYTYEHSNGETDTYFYYGKRLQKSIQGNAEDDANTDLRMCFDCNTYDNRNQLCTFVAQYFFDVRASDTSLYLICPWKSESESFEYHPTQDNTMTSRTWDYESTTTANKYIFWDGDGNTDVNQYPYCKVDLDAYTYMEDTSATDDYQESDTICPRLSYLPPNYGTCTPAFPGFIN